MIWEIRQASVLRQVRLHLRRELAGSGDTVSVGQPRFQGMLENLANPFLLGSCRGVIQDHLPGCDTVGTQICI